MAISSLNQSIYICDKNTGQQGWITALTATLKKLQTCIVSEIMRDIG